MHKDLTPSHRAAAAGGHKGESGVKEGAHRVLQLWYWCMAAS